MSDVLSMDPYPSTNNFLKKEIFASPPKVTGTLWGCPDMGVQIISGLLQKRPTKSTEEKILECTLNKCIRHSVCSAGQLLDCRLTPVSFN
ncbi:hypothetical protein AVEN_134988-1 [Araneus ventricosus]|uniref:Uncharacterized protein n=1 Tax=Araneus ventricosus TaxID=182803 RepID=A0A4Y2V4Z7_ARAVE|nr:hypothetical protein AVEN_134988-1 [Araneus ventricosus]